MDDICGRLLLSPNSTRIQRFILTDICFSSNFNILQYVLEFDDDMSPNWVLSPDWDPEDNLYKDEILVHFAAGLPTQSAHESDAGGFFTQSFCTAMKSPRTLPALLKTVRNNVEILMRKNGKGEGLQVPQLYSSYRFDFNDMTVMKRFGFFRKSTSHT